MGSASFTFQMKNDLTDADYLSELRSYDRTFLNSVLSYAIYTKNSSWFENWAQLKAMNPHSTMLPADIVSKDDIFKKESRAHDRVFAVMVSQFFSPVELDLKSQDKHAAPNYLYGFDSEYKNGIYKSLDNLSGACAMKSKNDDGTYTLHISFRGTDTQAQPFGKYLAKAYPDMAAYYDSFKPFEKACIEYANDKTNKISKIEVSGHSLGGAMVQHFFRSPDIKSLKQPLEGMTFGSPHALSNPFYAFLPAIRHLIKHKNIKNMINTSYDLLNAHLMRFIPERESRITQYQHDGDLIPKVAALAMQKTGNIVVLPDNVTPINDHLLTNADKSYYASMYKKMSEKPNLLTEFKNMVNTVCETVFIKPLRKISRIFNFTYHDMARYCINIENMMSTVKENRQMNSKTRYVEVYDFKSPTPAIDSYHKVCRSMKIQTKGTAHLEGQEVVFNEYTNPNEKFLSISIKLSNLIRENLKENIEGIRSVSYRQDSPPQTIQVDFK